MAQTAIQLYSLRNVDRPFTELLEEVADAGFDGVEFAYRVTDEDPNEVVATLEDTGLSVAGAHVGIDGLEAEFEDTIEFYETLGCEEIVIPALSEESFASREAVGEAIARLEAVEEDVNARGHTLHYHNHHFEYTSLNGRTGYDVLVDESSINLQIDVGLALMGGDDPVERIRSVGDRCRLLHLKDVDLEAGESVPLGDGDVDIDGCGEAFRSVGGEWLIYEFEGENPIASLQPAADRMSTLT